jgi:hypothetical protein
VVSLKAPTVNVATNDSGGKKWILSFGMLSPKMKIYYSRLKFLLQLANGWGMIFLKFAKANVERHGLSEKTTR